jgi:hypothetical protein
MAKKKTRKSSKKTSGAALLRAAAPRYLAWAAVLTLLAVALCMGSTRVWAAISCRPEFILDSSALSFRNCPSCARADYMAEQLRKQLTVALGSGSIFEKDLCERVERELRASPCFWVREVRSVRRLMPRKLEVDLVFRQPAALVQFGDYSYMVDMDGYWLPDDLYYRTGVWGNQSLPVIVNRNFRGAPPYARQWDGPALAAGIRLYDFLLKEGVFEQLPMKAIDVTHVGESGDVPDIVLLTRGGALVKWGCSDAYAELEGLSLPSWEHPDSGKLEMLRAKLGEFPGLDKVEYIDLRFPTKIYVRPASERPGHESVSMSDSGRARN